MVPRQQDPQIVALRQSLDQRLSELRLDRSGVEADWREITGYILPERGRYLPKTAPSRPRGSSIRILDPCASKAANRLAAFQMAGITNPSLPWMHLAVADDDVSDEDDVRSWLSECTRRMMRVLASGTFYNALHQLYEEVGGFGTGVILMLPDFEDVVRFHPLTVGEYYIALDSRQEVDTVYREYSLSVAQVVEQFGLDQCSAAVRTLYANERLSADVVIVHAIEPNRDRKPGRLGWQSMAYRSVYFERGQNDGILRAEGFHHRPFIAPRWHALAGDPYGVGPGHRALPDVKSLQAGVRQLREAAEKLLNPPLQGDAKSQNHYQGLLPGDVNWIAGLDVQPHAGLRPIFTVPPTIAPLAQEVEGYRRAIGETFFNDLILAISQMEGVQPRNQLEIMERRNEKMLMLGPMLERFYTEALGPAVRYVFARMQQVGIIPRAPSRLHGRMVEPTFVSVLAAAQKSVGTTSIEALVRLAGSMAGVWQGVTQKIDPDQVIEEYGTLLDVPNKIIVPQATVDAVRAQQNKLAQQQQAAEMAQKLATGAQTLSETNVGGGQNALAAMLGRGGGAPG